MARESFSDEGVAQILNRDYVAVKVDREERPDVDALYMRMGQMLGSRGGWPNSIFTDGEGKPFYAGTYFPKDTFIQLLSAISTAWNEKRELLLQNGELVTKALSDAPEHGQSIEKAPIVEAAQQLRGSFDKEFGGFGEAPKFPSPHILMFMQRAEAHMAQETLEHMYRGGIFDHIGGGFSRYSTDRFWLVPHFEKMLYDNALLAIAYMMAYEHTGKEFYKSVADKVFNYMQTQLRDENGGFYAAEDADSAGEEGQFYLFTPEELRRVLGKEKGKQYCREYGISSRGHLDGASVPNLISGGSGAGMEEQTQRLLAYRRERHELHMDKKQLAAWNSLAACAYAVAARVTMDNKYLEQARLTLDFIEKHLTKGDRLFVSVTDGRQGESGFLDDYSFYAYANYEMYQACQEESYLKRACTMADRAIEQFFDSEHGGFYFTGTENQNLAGRIKESYDGAIPSGNSVMYYVLDRLELLTGNDGYASVREAQRLYMNAEASRYPAGCAFYLYASLPVKKVVCAVKDVSKYKPVHVKSDWAFMLTQSSDYPLLDGSTTYYVCEGEACLPPTKEIPS